MDKRDNSDRGSLRRKMAARSDPELEKKESGGLRGG